MYLALEVVSPQAAALGPARRRVVGPAGLTIGRGNGNDWVFPDDYISRQHARIVYDGSGFKIEGLGRNPIAIGSPENPIPNHQPRPLRAGDRLFIDEYEIRVSAGHERAAATADRIIPEDPFGIVDAAAPGPPAAGGMSARPSAPRVPEGWPAQPTGAVDETAEHDPLAVLGGATREEPAPAPVNLQQSSPLSDHFEPPVPRPVAPAIPLDPNDWDRSVIVSPRLAPQPGPRPRQPVSAAPPPAAPVAAADPKASVARPAARPVGSAGSSPTSAVGADLAELLRGVGLPDGALSAEVLHELGKVLRIVVQGVMEVLKARDEIKAQFRLPLTRVQADENNPLKLCPNVESALHTLLVHRDPGYLSTVPAFEAAFADIRSHQLAMLAGVRLAFESMLERFEPRALEQEFERAVSRGGRLGFGVKSKYWDLYVERFSHLGRDADDTFRRLFGDVFAEAYEQQLERLKSLRK
jgi:type VI secretion system FHA domain protein